MTKPELLVDGVDFGEGPRWHEGKLWYSDFYQAAIYSVTTDGDRVVEYGELPDRPSGLGWMPDGTLLVVFMTSRRVMRSEGGTLVPHADLGDLAAGHCNDLVVDAAGNAYVGNFGFDLESGADPAPTNLHLVRPDGSVEVAAENLLFPNGAVITPDGSTLIVGETFGGSFSAYDINDDATLTNHRVWAEVQGTAPDGCCLDADGAIWYADAMKPQVIRVGEGGDVLDRIDTEMATFACMLGGDDGRTLFIVCSPGAGPDEVSGKAAGAIYATTVEVPHAGRP